MGNKNIITNIYRIQAYDSTICGYFCVGFIDFMLKDKSLFDYTNLFSPNDYEKIKRRINRKGKMKKSYCVICGNYQKFEKPKISYILEKAMLFSTNCSKYENDYEKTFKEEESIEILKLLGLIENI